MKAKLNGKQVNLVKNSETGIKYYPTYNDFVAISKDWKCGLGESDSADTELALHVEIIDMADATGEAEFEQYPYLVCVSVVAANPHESFYEGDYEGQNKVPTQIELIQDCVGYMGGVPVDHKLLDLDHDNQNLTDKLSIRDACLVTKAYDYGTIAAQRGKGTEFTYPRFKHDDLAEKWAKQMIETYSGVLMGMLIGFTLDAPINMMGETGWGVIEKQVKGCK